MVLDAALELFAERSLDVSFDGIARRAQVGVGTVYRRFPDREELVVELFALPRLALDGLHTRGAATSELPLRAPEGTELDEVARAVFHRP